MRGKTWLNEAHPDVRILEVETFRDIIDLLAESDDVFCPIVLDASFTLMFAIANSQVTKLSPKPP